MLKLQPALWLEKCHVGLVASHTHLFHTEDGNGPPLLQQHLNTLLTKDFTGRGGDGDDAAFLVEIDDAPHAFAGEQLGVPLRSVATKHGAIFADDESGGVFAAAVLRTDEERLFHAMSPGFDEDADAASATDVAGASPFAGLPQGIVEASVRLDDDVASPCSQGWEYYHEREEHHGPEMMGSAGGEGLANV